MPLWTPANASGAVFWVDGTCQMFSADTGGSLVTSGGAAVGRVVSRLPSALEFKQATGAQRPELFLGAVALPGTPRCLKVVSADKRLVSDSRAFSGNMTMFAVLRAIGTNNSPPAGFLSFYRYFGRFAGAAPQFAFLNGSISSQPTYRSAVNSAGSGGSVSPDITDPGSISGDDFGTQWNLFTLQKTATGGSTSIVLRLNGGASSSSGTSNGWVGATTTMGICGASGDSQTQNHELAAFVLVEGDTSATDPRTKQSICDSVEGYLAWTYGLQANLPAGHAFKNAAPRYGQNGGRVNRQSRIARQARI